MFRSSLLFNYRQAHIILDARAKGIEYTFFYKGIPLVYIYIHFSDHICATKSASRNRIYILWYPNPLFQLHLKYLVSHIWHSDVKQDNQSLVWDHLQCNDVLDVLLEQIPSCLRPAHLGFSTEEDLQNPKDISLTCYVLDIHSKPSLPKIPKWWSGQQYASWQLCTERLNHTFHKFLKGSVINHLLIH